jgi:hypothetical protein
MDKTRIVITRPTKEKHHATYAQRNMLGSKNASEE